MIEIAISCELQHPRFMAECLERGHQVEVLESSAGSHRPMARPERKRVPPARAELADRARTSRARRPDGLA